MSWVRNVLLAGCLVVAGLATARAAELRVDFAELARVVQGIVAGAKIRLHNVPGGLFDPGSTVTVGSVQRSLELAPTSFNLLQSTYAYYVNDINSTSVRVTPVSGALRLTIMFETEGPELVGGCISGSCSMQNALPDIEWARAGVNIDLVPVRFNGSVSLQVTKVELLGQLDPVCRGTAGFISGNVCSLALPSARRKIQTLQGEINGVLKSRVNDPGMQAGLAGSLKKYLVLGPAGEVQISSLAVDAKGIVVSFKLAGQQ